MCAHFHLRSFNSVECVHMVKTVLNVVCRAHGIEWRGLADPGGNFDHGSEVYRSSGRTINVIMLAQRSAGPGLSWRFASTHCTKQWETHRTLVHSISRVYAVRYFMSLSDGDWNQLVQGVRVWCGAWFCVSTRTVMQP
jgi:hypothetical protein